MSAHERWHSLRRQIVLIPRTGKLEIPVAHERHAPPETARSSGAVLVCCALGFSRSALAVAAWLLDMQHARTTAEALAQVRWARSAMAINATQEMALIAWWKQRPCGTIGT